MLENVRFNSEECVFVASSKQYLKQHVQAKHENVIYSCVHCEYKATAKGSLRIHSQVKHENKEQANNFH